MFDQLDSILHGFAQAVPVPIFAFIGSILEEIIAPIPSPFVMTTTGSLLAASDAVLSSILLIGLIAAAGKTLGCIFFYVLADKAEDIVIKKYGRYLGFSHTQLESIGKHFQRSWKDDVLLIILRAIPVMPSTPISLVAGFIKLNMRTFIVSSFIGNFIRALTFLYIGYEGLTALSQGIDSLESVIKILVVLILGVIVAYIYYKRGKGDLHDTIKKKLRL